jgi:hypothetical protein
MPDDYYDQDTGEESAIVDEQVDVPEEKLGLVPMSFFKNKVNPGDREKIEVVKIYDNEVAIKCIYGDKEESSEDDDDMEMAGPSEAEADELMG